MTMIFAAVLVVSPVSAQNSDKKDKDKKSADAKTSQIAELQPAIGIQPAFTLAIGDLGPKAGIGFGAFLYAELRMPIKPMVFNLNLGFTGGFIYHGKFMMAPVMLYAKPMLQFNPGAVFLRPYLKLGGGISPVFGSAGSSFDPTFSGGLGLGIVPAKAPSIEITIEANYLMLFETLRGDFINVNIGVAYRFGVAEEKKK